jgi:hypothetical protein
VNLSTHTTSPSDSPPVSSAILLSLNSFLPLISGVWRGSCRNRHVSPKKNDSGKLCMEKQKIETVEG